MDKQKHTPAPWTVKEADTFVKKVIGSDGYPIAYVEEGHKRDSEANARLIAAAPELLEACKYVLGHKAVGEQTPAGDLLDKVEAAVAKAEGEENV